MKLNKITFLIYALITGTAMYFNLLIGLILIVIGVFLAWYNKEINVWLNKKEYKLE